MYDNRSISDKAEMTYGPASRLFARTSVRITILILIGISFMMFLHSQNQAKMMRLQEIGNDIAARTPTQFDLNAQFSLEFDENCKVCIRRSSSKIHVVTNFFPMSVVAGRAKFLPPGANWNSRVKPNRADTKRLVEERDRELLDVLQMNLNNNGILAIHIIYHDERVVKHIMNQRLRFTHKLVFHWVQSTNPTYEDALLYIGKYLLDQLVVFTNQDIYLERGWDILDHREIKERKLMYALTRHGKEERFVLISLRVESPCIKMKFTQHPNIEAHALAVRAQRHVRSHMRISTHVQYLQNERKIARAGTGIKYGIARATQELRCRNCNTSDRHHFLFYLVLC